MTRDEIIARWFKLIDRLFHEGRRGSAHRAMRLMLAEHEEHVRAECKTIEEKRRAA